MPPVFFCLSSLAQTSSIPQNYKLLKGSWSASNGASGPIELYVDAVENPAKGFLTLASRFCSSTQKEIAIKKTTVGFIFEVEMGGRCKESVFNITGPNSDNKYSGTFTGDAGATNLDMSLVAAR